jgi:hypothetical protein
MGGVGRARQVTRGHRLSAITDQAPLAEPVGVYATDTIDVLGLIIGVVCR